jgi:hypothetical protein
VMKKVTSPAHFVSFLNSADLNLHTCQAGDILAKISSWVYREAVLIREKQLQFILFMSQHFLQTTRSCCVG